MTSMTAAVDPVSVSIAGAALLVAVISAVFQIFSWQRGHKTRVEPILRAMVLQPEDDEVALVQLVNHSGHEVAVTHLSFKPQKEGDPWSFIPRPFPTTEPVPIIIAPRRSKTIWVLRKTLDESHDLDRPVQVCVSTDDNNDFDSKPTQLDWTAPE